MIRKAPSNRPGKVLVTFEFPAEIWAESVHLVGDFNDWNETSLPLIQSRQDERWRITLELDADREYQFRYLVNGADWHNDWHADKYVSNLHGADNSVVVTTLSGSEDASEGTGKTRREQAAQTTGMIKRITE